jgi:hypothetical protein
MPYKVPPQRLVLVSASRPAVHPAVPLSVMALGFFAFIPYPALGIGNTSAIQIGNVLSALMCLPLLLNPRGRAPLWIGAVLMAPLLTATVATGVFGEGDLSLAIKELPTYVLAGLTLVVVQFYAPGNALELLTGIAAATVAHAAVGAWQVYAFASGDLPLFSLYVNQSFLSVRANAGAIAKYTQRPFGIFPEPSAMSSSLAPFVLFWVVYLAGLVKPRREPAPWQRALFAAAAVGGLALMIVSQSGHTAIALVAMLPLGAMWLARSRATARTFISLVLVLCVLVPLLVWLAGIALSERVGGRTMGNSSWDERWSSLAIGFSLLTEEDFTRVLVGVGLGGTAPALWRVARVDAVYSVLLTYVYETGLVGLLAIATVSAYLARVWKSIRFDTCFAAIFLTWLVGVTVTTSYAQLLPLWVALAWLTVWPEVCQPAGAAAEAEEEMLIESPLLPAYARPSARFVPKWPVADRA